MVPDFSDDWYLNHVHRLCFSFKYWTGKNLLSDCNKTNLVLELFEAPFVIVSHGIEPVPIFNFANRNALELFEMGWNDFINLPSKKSADYDNQDERAVLMQRVSRNGFATDCEGVRISSSGKRFLITGATVWNVLDEQKNYHGQAAVFTEWSYL